MKAFNTIFKQSVLGLALVAAIILGGSGVALAAKECGAYPDNVVTSIDIGCTGKGGSIADLTFAIIRFITAGVGIVVVGSIVVGGIQYTISRGDPQAMVKAMERIRSSVIALLIFIFAYAMLGYIIPGQFLK